MQRTPPCVTATASTATFPPAVQVPRRTPRSLSLGSLGARTGSQQQQQGGARAFLEVSKSIGRSRSLLSRQSD